MYNVSIVLKVTYVLADIHGDNAAFDDILWQIGFSDDDRLFIIGNVIDREGDGDRAASAHYENAERHAGVGFSYGEIIPRKPKRPSAYPGCPNLTDGTYCAEHKKYAQLQYSKLHFFRKWKRLKNERGQRGVGFSNSICGNFITLQQIPHIRKLIYIGF